MAAFSGEIIGGEKINCKNAATRLPVVNVWGKRFKLPQLTHAIFLTIDHSCKIFFWYLPNWTSTNLWCVVLYATYSTTHQRSVEVQFGRYQKNILQEWCRVKKLSCVSCGSLKRFPHTFTNATVLFRGPSDTNLVEKCAKIAAICYGLLQPFPSLCYHYRVKAFLKLHRNIFFKGCFQRFQTAVN